jgi:hypothetical protein
VPTDKPLVVIQPTPITSVAATTRWQTELLIISLQIIFILSFT